MRIFDAAGHDQEEEAVVHFAQATEELMAAGLAMAKRQSPAQYAALMASIRGGEIRPQLVVRFDSPVRISLVGITPDDVEAVSIFSFAVQINTHLAN